MIQATEAIRDSSSHSSFDDLLTQHRVYVFGVCFRVLRDEQAAEDACQETFWAAWRSGPVGAVSLRAWLTRVALNKSIDMLRRRRHECSLEASLEEGAAEPEAATRDVDLLLIDAEVGSELKEALAQLPYEQRLVMLLLGAEGLPYHDIAQETGTSVGTVKSRIFRARKALRSLIGEQR